MSKEPSGLAYQHFDCCSESAERIANPTAAQIQRNLPNSAKYAVSLFVHNKKFLIVLVGLSPTIYLFS
jgi:hypothetical protein